jgi:hypothetical protein
MYVISDILKCGKANLNINTDGVLGTASISAIITLVNIVTLLPLMVGLLQTYSFHSNTACVARGTWITTEPWVQVRASNPAVTWFS